MPALLTSGADAFYVIITFSVFVAFLRVFDICVFSSRPPPGSEADADLRAAQDELAPQDMSEAEFQDILRELKKIDAEMSALAATGDVDGGDEEEDGGDNGRDSGGAQAAASIALRDAGESVQSSSPLDVLKAPAGAVRPPPPPPPPPPRSSASKKGGTASPVVPQPTPTPQESAAVAELQDGFLTSSFTQAYHAHLRRRA